MKRLFTFVFTLVVSYAFAQQSEVVYEGILLTPNKKEEAQLIAGVKAHNKKYHSKGKTTASLYYIVTGPNAGKYAWLNGPMTFADMDNWPNSTHMTDWQKNIRNFVVGEEAQYAQLNWEASYTPPSWGSPNVLLLRTFKINNKMDSRSKVMEAIIKIKEALEAMKAPNPRRVYESAFRSGEGTDITLVYPIKNWAAFSTSKGLPADFQTKYDAINGAGAFRRDVGEVLSTYTDGWYDEIRVLVE